MADIRRFSKLGQKHLIFHENKPLKFIRVVDYYIVGFLLLLSLYSVNGTDRNIALSRATWQSQTFNETTTSNLAVDGDVMTCSATSDTRDSNWTIDLGDIHVIARIKINTGNTFFGNTFEIYLSTVIHQTTVTEDGSVINMPPPCNFGPTSDIKEVYVLSCFDGAKLGRYLTIRNLHSGGVKLCDVQVIECKDGYFDINCTKQCHCAGDAACDKVNGHCPDEKCAPGWTGLNGTECQAECVAGTFGPGCSSVCHCLNADVCDRFTGHCPSTCAKNWFGPSCQTDTPSVLVAPTAFSATAADITLSWHSWNRFVDPTIHLVYHIEYRLNRHHGNHTWMEGAMVADTTDQNQRIAVSGLAPNSFYDFRVTPILYEGSTELVRGLSSPVGLGYSTKCTAPETTNITRLESWTDLSRRVPQAVILVEWTLLTEDQINCENVKYYQVIYGRHTELHASYTSGARNTENAKNITTNVDFATEYWVVVVAYNNQGLDSSSLRSSIVTPAKPPETIDVKQSHADIAIIAGVIVCVGLLVAIVLAFILYRNKVKNYNSIPNKDTPRNGVVQNEMYIRPTPMTESLLETSVAVNDLTVVPMYPANNRINKVRKEKPAVKRFPIKVDELEEYINSRQNNELEEIRKEYREIPEGNTEGTTIFGERQENRLKNRFVNIMPYDHSRVILDKIEGDEDSDYINANYLNGYNKPKFYIAAQGCNKWTIQDMWRMIWQVHSLRIVMVTNLVEKGKTKCELYWPETENEPKSYGGDLVVTLTDVEKTADFVIRSFDLRCGAETRNIKQLHYTTWPDHGVPTRTSPIIAFRRKLRSYDDTHPGTIVVHCSAGVGRTGAFIAIDYLLEQAVAEGVVNVHALTSSMRKDRVNMIQTVEQYLFVYDALLEALKAGTTVIACNDFKVKYAELRHIDPVKGKSRLVEQFETLQAMALKGIKSSVVEPTPSGTLEENKEKNRFPELYPADKHRPYLMTRVQGTNDYINAVFIDGYRLRNAYLTTQMPLPHTVIDLWRMVFEHKSSTIVMLNPWDESDPTYGQYWPEENEECECGPFIIEAMSLSKAHRDITIRELKLSYNPDLMTSSSSATTSATTAASRPTSLKDATPRTITHFQLTCWGKEESVPAAPQSLAALIDMVEHAQKKSGPNPVVIHCHDGVRQSGLYATMTSVWERMKDEQEVDIFQTVRHLRYHRPQIMVDVEQYQFCHEMVLTYLDDFALYSNYR